MGKRYWRIRGMKNVVDMIFDETIPLGSITDDQLKELLKCLAAVANGLPLGEIVGAYVKRKTKRANEDLSVRSNFPGTGWQCGPNHGATFIAIVVDEEGKRIDPPRPFA